MTRWPLRLVLLFLVQSASSPTGTEAQILQTDVISSFQTSDTTSPFTGLLNFGFSVEQQLNTVVEFSAGSDMVYSFSRDAIVLAAKAKRTYAGDLRVTNSGYGHLRYLYRRRRPLGIDGFTQIQWDGPRGMKNRFLLGANLRVNVVRDSSSSLDLAAGLMGEHEEWNYDGVERDRRPSDLSPVSVDHPRVNTYIRYFTRIGQGASLLLTNYVQSRTDTNFTRPRIATAVQLSLRVSDRFSFTVNYNSIYDFAPVVPIRKYYFTVSNELSFRFR